MSKVVIDCRYLTMSGIGRFLENILANLDFNKNKYTLLGKKELIEKYKGVNYIYDNNSPFSPKSLFKTNYKLINKHDYFLIPNFIIPYGIKCKVITVFHDIIFLERKEVNRNYIEYRIKKHLIKRCMKKSQNVFTVSQFSLDRIAHYNKKYQNKLKYTYQGVAPAFLNQSKCLNKENYIVYVGNIKKHKGLLTLLEAYKSITKEDKSLKLYIVGDASSFKNGDEEVEKMLNLDGVIFTGKLNDDKLIDIVKKARFLIQPSLYEGFGIPPLEALYLGTRPIISDIAVFKEVYSKLPVIFFEVNNVLSLKEKIINSDPNFTFDKEEANKKFSYKKFASLIENELNK